MVTTSTFVYILEDPGNESVLTDINNLLYFGDDFERELDDIFSVFDYSPSVEAMNKILRHVYEIS